mmetsp:Transcript_39952/g.103405  ORF Transcript_39952/g.103405 Transcript_39952/m.103405 type:complete len:209 (+) Transcript_39952:522-1148(+)
MAELVLGVFRVEVPEVLLDGLPARETPAENSVGHRTVRLHYVRQARLRATHLREVVHGHGLEGGDVVPLRAVAGEGVDGGAGGGTRKVRNPHGDGRPGAGGADGGWLAAGSEPRRLNAGRGPGGGGAGGQGGAAAGGAEANHREGCWLPERVGVNGVIGVRFCGLNRGRRALLNKVKAGTIRMEVAGRGQTGRQATSLVDSSRNSAPF